MTEKSLMWTTGALGDGAAEYTMAELIRWLRQTYLSDNTDEGILKGYGGDLAVSGVASPVSIATGGALVYGFPYWQTTTSTMAIPTPAVNTRIDRVVLSADWVAQTVRLERVAGVEGGAAPALTQVDATEWQVSLAQCSITIGGVITVSDERVFIHPNWEIEIAQAGTDLDGDGIQGGDGTAFAVDVSDFAGDGLSDDGAENLDVNVDAATIEISGGNLQVVAGSLTTAHIANRTRTLFVPCTFAWNVTAGAKCAYNSVRGWALADNAICYAYATAAIPADTTSVTIEAIYNTGGAGNAFLYEADAYHGAADGEAYNTNGSALSAYQAFSKTRDDKFESTSIGTLSGTGDLILLQYARDAVDAQDTMAGIVYFTGFLLSYTADM